MAPMNYKAAQTNINATPQWDPYKVLDIYHNNNRTLSCVGTSRTNWNSRCRWQFFSDVSLPILASLDKMAACNPRTITQKQLKSLAELCLCRQNHQDQAAQKVREWQVKIADFLDEYDRTATLIARVDQLNLLLQNALDENSKLKQRVEDALQADEAARAKEFEWLNRQVGDVRAEFEKYRMSTAMDFNALMEQLQASSTDLKDARIANEEGSREIDELKGQLKQGNAHSEAVKQATEKQIDGLKAEVEASNIRLSKAQTEASSRIDDLGRRLKASEECLEEQERTSSQAIGSLTQQLRDSKKELDTLKIASAKDVMNVDYLHQQLQDLSKEYADSKTKSASRISDLQKENHTLKVRAHFNRFRMQAQLVVKKKQIEQEKSTNATLSEQNGRLMERIGVMNRQLADQSVSFVLPLVSGAC